jgi:hypothetical protein
MAQSNLVVQYEYDAAGNRTLRKTIDLSPQYAPPAPEDTTTSHLPPHTSHLVPHTADYFVETIAQTEIKIYPNPTTEKITLEISGWQDLQTGVFKLFSLHGQLLKDYPIHSSTTIISLSELPKGVYILKVIINGKSEDWKIIKN